MMLHRPSRICASVCFFAFLRCTCRTQPSARECSGTAEAGALHQKPPPSPTCELHVPSDRRRTVLAHRQKQIHAVPLQLRILHFLEEEVQDPLQQRVFVAKQSAISAQQTQRRLLERQNGRQREHHIDDVQNALHRQIGGRSNAAQQVQQTLHTLPLAALIRIAQLQELKLAPRLGSYFLNRFVERLQHKLEGNVVSQQHIAVPYDLLRFTHSSEHNTLTERRFSRKSNMSSSFICAASFASFPLIKTNRRELQMRQRSRHELIHQLVNGRPGLWTLQHHEQLIPEGHAEICDVDGREGVQDEHRLDSTKLLIPTSSSSPLYMLLSSISSDK